MSERYRRRGLGRTLVDEAISRARARGCSRFELDVVQGNRGAIELYAAAGLSETPKGPGPSRIMGLRL